MHHSNFISILLPLFFWQFFFWFYTFVLEIMILHSICAYQWSGYDAFYFILFFFWIFLTIFCSFEGNILYTYLILKNTSHQFHAFFFTIFCTLFFLKKIFCTLTKKMHGTNFILISLPFFWTIFSKLIYPYLLILLVLQHFNLIFFPSF